MVLFIAPPVIAHRGASSHAPENTLAAFRKAKALGLNWVEFDVMLSSCGEAVVIHDETLERTTNGHGKVCDYTYAELATLDAGSWFNPAFAGEKIPTLAEVIQLLMQQKISANIEIKPSQGREAATVKKVLSVVQQYWHPQAAAPLISSFSHDVLLMVHQLMPSSQLGFLMHEWQADWMDFCDRIASVAVDVNEKILTQEKVKEIKASGRSLLAYTVNQVERARELFSWGVDAVFSDHADEIAAAI